MTLRIFVSRDAGAVAVGADEVALVLGLAAQKRGTEIEIIRTGSRGLYWRYRESPSTSGNSGIPG